MYLKIELYKRKPAICSGCEEEYIQGYNSEKEVIVEDLSSQLRHSS